MGKIDKAKEERKKKLFFRNLTLRLGASQAAVRTLHLLNLGCVSRLITRQACDTEPIASAPPVEPVSTPCR